MSLQTESNQVPFSIIQMKCRSREYKRQMEKFRIYQKLNHREKLQDEGGEGHALVFSYENSKIAANR